jgi:hypothetical protein
MPVAANYMMIVIEACLLMMVIILFVKVVTGRRDMNA